MNRQLLLVECCWDCCIVFAAATFLFSLLQLPFPKAGFLLPVRILLFVLLLLQCFFLLLFLLYLGQSLLLLLLLRASLLHRRHRPD